MKFTIKTIGCKVNTYESNKIKDELTSLGFTFIDVNEKDSYKDLDYYIINTCSVTALADKKSRQMIHSARTKNSKMKIVATGCSISKILKCEEKIEGVDIEISNDNKNNLVKIILNYISKSDNICYSNANKINNINDVGNIKKNIDNCETKVLKHCKVNNFNEKNKIFDDYIIDENIDNKINDKIKPINKIITNDNLSEERVRAFIKIEDGCDEYCTYCIIPYLRGHVKSRTDEEIIDDIKKHLKRGVKEIVLTGIHLSSFGLDREKIMYENKEAITKARHNLITLINKITELSNDKEFDLKRLRLGSLEPRIIDEDFIESLSSKLISDIFCPSFCLSLQSGSNKILKLMNRHYTIEDFEYAVKIIKKYFPTALITTDIIVGFPGETEDDYKETVDFVKKMRFYNPNIFPYSRREGTVANNMENQLTNKIKHDRSIKLINICNQINREIEEEYNKIPHEVLVEEKVYEKGKVYEVGYTKEYVKVRRLAT